MPNPPKLNLLKKIAATVQSNMDALYKTTYFSSPQASKDIKSLAQDMNDAIDSIVSRNMDTFGKPSISTLYTRILDKDSSKASSSISDLFEVTGNMDDMYSSFMSNRYLVELDQEIDTICKYMPELEEALDVLKDSALSADHFSKDFLTIKFPTNIVDEKFAQRIGALKDKYKLQTLTEQIYDDVSKYGEKFVYIIPYKVAIARLLANKPKTNLNKFGSRVEDANLITEAVNGSEFTQLFRFSMNHKGGSIVSDSGENFVLSESVIVHESSSPKKIDTITFESLLNKEKNESVSFNVELNMSGIIDSAVQEATRSNSIRHTTSSLRESFISGLGSKVNEDSKAPEAKGTLNSDNVFKNKTSSIATDGLVNSSKNEKDFMTKTPGAVIKYLKREQVIPVYIEQTCLGYYYIEFKNQAVSNPHVANSLTDPMSNIGCGLVGGINNIVDDVRQDNIIRYVAGQLSTFIDKKFVDANQDISKEIYEVLKCNDLLNTPSIDTVKITFIPPEDIHHCWFNFDEDTHRGISDLAKGLIPAKLYTSLLVSGAIGIMTRGQDKRVYYVNQMVDTNVAQQLLNVIEQVKLGNFGIRQFKSINNVLNIVGQFNEHIIPRTSGGQSPIDIDVIPGQQFDTHQELMEELKGAAIDSTTVPIEIIQTRKSVDYAMQLSMSSSKFLRTTYKRQEAVEGILSPIISTIYNYEYDESYDLKVVLPPPVFLDMANTTQLINNTLEAVRAMVDIEMASEEDDVLKNMYINNLFTHYIGTHIDITAHQSILEQTRIEKKRLEDESQIQAENPPDDNGGGDMW